MSYLDMFVGPEAKLQIYAWRIFHHVTTGPHELTCYLLTYATKNFSLHLWNRENDIIRQGDMLLIHPGQSHRFVSPCSLWMYHCLFEPGTVDAPYLSGLPIRVVHIPLSEQKRIESLYDRIAYKNTHAQYDPASIRSALGELLALYREQCASAPEGGKKGANHVYDAMRLLREDRTLSVPALAGALGLHPDYLNRIFRDNLGMTVTDFRIFLRITDAGELLETSDADIRTIAEELGYGSTSLFCAHFRRFYDMTPSEYRTIVRNDQTNMKQSERSDRNG